jgi:hypothetical protein
MPLTQVSGTTFCGICCRNSKTSALFWVGWFSATTIRAKSLLLIMVFKASLAIAAA